MCSVTSGSAVFARHCVCCTQVLTGFATTVSTCPHLQHSNQVVTVRVLALCHSIMKILCDMIHQSTHLHTHHQPSVHRTMFPTDESINNLCYLQLREPFLKWFSKVDKTLCACMCTSVCVCVHWRACVHACRCVWDPATYLMWHFTEHLLLQLMLLHHGHKWLA